MCVDLNVVCELLCFSFPLFVCLSDGIECESSYVCVFVMMMI